MSKVNITTYDGPEVTATAVATRVTVVDGGTTSAVGPQGPKGDPGPANSLAIGTVTTGAAGSSAAATITGTAPSQTLNLTIPRGDTGAAGTGGSSIWTPVINDPLTSAAAWTPLAGTWAVSGGFYSCTDSTQTPHRTRLTAKQPGAIGIIECEMQLAAGSGTHQRMGIHAGLSVNGAGAFVAFFNRLNGTDWQFSVEKDTSVNVATWDLVDANYNATTWYKLRLVHTGAAMDVYIGGVLLGSARIGGDLGVDAPGLYSYGSTPMFRNFKTWTLALPA